MSNERINLAEQPFSNVELFHTFGENYVRILNTLAQGGDSDQVNAAFDALWAQLPSKIEAPVQEVLKNLQSALKRNQSNRERVLERYRSVEPEDSDVMLHIDLYIKKILPSDYPHKSSLREMLRSQSRIDVDAFGVYHLVISEEAKRQMVQAQVLKEGAHGLHVLYSPDGKYKSSYSFLVVYEDVTPQELSAYRQHELHHFLDYALAFQPGGGRNSEEEGKEPFFQNVRSEVCAYLISDNALGSSMSFSHEVDRLLPSTNLGSPQEARALRRTVDKIREKLDLLVAKMEGTKFSRVDILYPLSRARSFTDLDTRIQRFIVTVDAEKRMMQQRASSESSSQEKKSFLGNLFRRNSSS